MDKEEQKRIGRRRFFQRLGLAVGACAGAYADARYIEPRFIEVSRHTAFLPELPLELDGMVVAQLSDIHYGPITPEATIRDAIALAVREKPDLVALTGDFINNRTHQATQLAPFLKPLQIARFGVLACMGNHDYRRGGAVAKILQDEAGVRFLRNESTFVAPGLAVVGLEDTTNGRPNAPQAFAGVPDSAACLYLTHSPTGIWGAMRRSCVALSGHTHGGQVRIPGFVPHHAVGMAGFPMLDGWGVFDRAQLFISRGVGMMHRPFRFLCPPEVAIVTLKRGDDVPQKTSDLARRAAKRAEKATVRVYRWLT
ncbi:MAG: metallophosphoesterase [Akkermansiaceae bacterium]|nr:metallophosphoesterase [Armatimonadota bacterium]